MTWSQVIATGEGNVEYRLNIEGFDYDFVTSQQMSNNSSYPFRMNGLLREGLKFNQSLKLPDPTLDLNGNTFTIVDYQEKATIAFYRTPTYSGLLMAALDTVQTIMQVDNTTNLSVGDYLWIGQEAIKVLSISPASSNTLYVLRGQLGTTPTAHFNTTDLGVLVRPTIQDCPFTIERKRAYLYAYGLGDDLQGQGTLIWRGIIKTQPRFQGTKYTIEIGPITDLLKSAIGVDGDDVKLKGINLGNYPWVITVELVEMNSDGQLVKSWGKTPPIDLTSDLGTNQISYFETLNEFIRNANQVMTFPIVTLIGGTPANYLIGGFALSEENELVFTSKCDVPGFGLVYRTSENPLTKGTTDKEDIGTDFFSTDGSREWKFFTNNKISSGFDLYPNANTQYCQPLKNRVQPFPAQYMIYHCATPGTTNEGSKFHIATYGFTSLVDSILINIEDVLVATTVAYGNNQLVSFDQTNNVLFAPSVSFPRSSPNTQQIAIVDNNYKISIGTAFLNYVSVDANGRKVQGTNVYDVIGFIRFLIQQTPRFVNSGLIPLLTTGDFDIEDMQAVFDSLSLKSLQHNRIYSFYKKIESLEKLLTEEFKLIGVYPALTYDGKMTIRKMQNINTLQTPDYILDSGDILTDNSYPTIDTNQFGIWNSIAISTNYNAMNQKWEGNTWTYNNIEAISQYGKQNQISVKPISSVLQQKSSSQDEAEINDYADIMYRSTSLLSKDYWVVSLDVPMKYFYLNLGSVIRIKNKQLPNYQPNFAYLTSRRGNGNVVGTLVGKNFDLAKGFGSITLLVTDREYSSLDSNTKAILAPDALITSVVFKGATIYEITLDAATSANYMAGTDTQETHWQAGDGIRIDQFDTATPNKGSAKILQITGTGNALVLTIDVQSPGSLPSGFTTGGRTWYMRPSDFNSALTSPRQQAYAFYDGGTVDVNNVNFAGTFKRILAF